MTTYSTERPLACALREGSKIAIPTLYFLDILLTLILPILLGPVRSPHNVPIQGSGHVQLFCCSCLARFVNLVTGLSCRILALDDVVKSISPAWPASAGKPLAKHSKYLSVHNMQRSLCLSFGGGQAAEETRPR